MKRGTESWAEGTVQVKVRKQETKILRSQVEGVGEAGEVPRSPTSISRGSCNRTLFSSQKLEKDF